MYNTLLDSTIGLLEIIADENQVIMIQLVTGPISTKSNSVCLQAKKELTEYLQGQRKEFTIPIKLKGTEFQQLVWQALIQIPFGELISYQELAKQINRPKSVRAVAKAVGANPLLIIVPCHRVIGTNHTLTGFSAGLENKLKLLNIEGIKIIKHHDLKKSKIRWEQ